MDATGDEGLVRTSEKTKNSNLNFSSLNALLVSCTSHSVTKIINVANSRKKVQRSIIKEDSIRVVDNIRFYDTHPVSAEKSAFDHYYQFVLEDGEFEYDRNKSDREDHRNWNGDR